jgi:hypothetical protein
MKKIYEHPAMDAVEIQFRSILMASDKGTPENPDDPFTPAPGRVF